MEDKDILIQCDEVTKNIMDELQEEMISSLNKVSKDMQNELLLNIKPVEKKVGDLKEDLSDLNEEVMEKVEDISKALKKMTDSMESILNECMNNMLMKEDNVLVERLNKVLKDTLVIKQGVKVNNDNTIAVNNKIDELQKSVEGNFFDNKMLFNEKLGSIKNIIDDKNLLIQTISNYEKEHENKLNAILEEVEYANKPFFFKLFNRRK